MKIAYITSLYPAVSHTFILNEIMELRRLGVEIGTFSVRRPSERDILGPDAEREGRSTRSILPLSVISAAQALGWCVLRRFRPLLKVLLADVLTRPGLKSKLMWVAYTMEGMVLARWLVEGGYEHLHCHFGNSGSNAAKEAAAIAGIPWSVTCHGSELNDPSGFFLPEKVRDAEFVACVSKFGKARLMHACPREDWGKLLVVRCGTGNPEPVAYPGNSADGPEVLCVGRLSSEKGHFILLDAIDSMQKRNVKVRLTLVGDGPLRAELEARAKLLPSPGDVRFTGAQDPEAVSGFFRSCSLVVLASFSEGVPIVLMEAFSHGRPVVATRVGGIPELVQDRVSGLLVSPGDASDLASAMERVLSDRNVAETMGKNGAEKLLVEFNRTVGAKYLKSLFEASVRKHCVDILQSGGE